MNRYIQTADSPEGSDYDTYEEQPPARDRVSVSYARLFNALGHQGLGIRDFKEWVKGTPNARVNTVVHRYPNELWTLYHAHVDKVRMGTGCSLPEAQQEADFAFRVGPFLDRDYAYDRQRGPVIHTDSYT